MGRAVAQDRDTALRNPVRHNVGLLRQSDAGNWRERIFFYVLLDLAGFQNDVGIDL